MFPSDPEPAPLHTRHYENFPVASVLCPPRLRRAISAIYGFARSADDLADEGDAPAARRLADLAAFGRDLRAVASQQPHSGQWPDVFDALGGAVQRHDLPVALLAQLLDAFEQDVRFSAAGQRYETDVQLLDYCSRSANPIGRLLLHLYGVSSAQALALSDDICTALQLINFWQDLSLDIPRRRYYATQEACANFGVLHSDLLARRQTPTVTHLIAANVAAARARLAHGAALVHLVPGRAGWELRLVVQGGARILDKIEALQYATLQTRVHLSWRDAPLMLWRALWM